MNKTHPPDSPITERQYNNHQVALYFCARRSAKSGTRTSVGRSVGLSAGSKNVVHFHPVTPKNMNQILGSIKT
jgi:hypothetical protein